MLLKHSKRRVATIALISFVLLLAAPIAYIWFTAPPDPKFHGERLSTLLYEAYGTGLMPRSTTGRVGARQFDGNAAGRDCHAALEHLGPKAAPLLTAWIQNRPSFLRDKIRELLIRRKINWPYFTANHQDIVERLFFSVPSAAVPLAEAFQWQIINGPERDASRAATLLAYVINSTDTPSREYIAASSGPLVTALLDKYEREQKDFYALSLIGPILKNHPAHRTLEIEERIRRHVVKSRYLESALAVINTPAPAPSRQE
jgi:hypothetical protein